MILFKKLFPIVFRKNVKKVTKLPGRTHGQKGIGT